MARNYKQARKAKGLRLIDVAERLDVSQPTLSAWESERKAPSAENLEKMASLYHVSVDYLLGRTTEPLPETTKAVPLTALPVLHGVPVWSVKYGWLLVNCQTQSLIGASGESIPFKDAGEIFLSIPQFAGSVPQTETPLTFESMIHSNIIWVEPISPDSVLREELRGRYHVKNNWVENESGVRFSFENYGVKWLAFEL